MKEKKTNNLKININRVYTKKGDSGETYLVGGHLVSKDSLRVEAYGQVDELNSFLGGCISLINKEFVNNDSLAKLSELFNNCQQELFNLECWALTCESFFDTDEWIWIYNHFGYKGDYEFIFFE